MSDLQRQVREAKRVFDQRMKVLSDLVQWEEEKGFLLDHGQEILEIYQDLERVLSKVELFAQTKNGS